MIESLAYQNDLCAGLHKLLNRLHTFRFQARFQLVLEVFFAQEIQAIAGHAAQNRVNHPGGEFAVGGVEKWTQHGHQKDEAATPEALGKGLRVPGKESDWPDDGQVQKAPLNPPVNGRGAGTGIRV